MRPPLHVFVPSNRTYESRGNRGRRAPMDGLNEINRQNRTNRYYGASKERENVEWVAFFVRRAMREQGYAPMTRDDRCKCHVCITVVEPHDRRDVPNVYGGVLKYALDALTARNRHGTGAIWDDNSKWMALTPKIRIDPDNPGLEITVIALEDKDEA